jgi:mannan endo-1,4-beta-mannosidase
MLDRAARVLVPVVLMIAIATLVVSAAAPVKPAVGRAALASASTVAALENAASRPRLVKTPAPVADPIKASVAPAPPPSPTGLVTRNGTNLYVDGSVYRYAGITANELATYWPVNSGCGAMVQDLDGFFSSLRPGTMVSFTATQAMAFNNKTTGTIDFTGIDRVIAAAERHGQKLEISLAGQSGDCDEGHYKNQAWYDGGYRQVFNDDGRNLSRLSYWDYIHLIVPRYKNSPAVAIWEPVGEPEASNCLAGLLGHDCYGATHLVCPSGATSSLRRFFDTVGAEVKSLDPNHLISTGTLSRLQCGLAGGGYRQVLESPYVDVASFHDYGFADSPLPADLGGALQEAHAANKVFVMDEGGIFAGTGCQTTTQRAGQFKSKMDAQFSAGSSGFQAWNWVPTASGVCDTDITPSDPIMGLMLTYQMPLMPLLGMTTVLQHP